MHRLGESLREAPIITKGDYQYFVRPICHGSSISEPKQLRKVVISVTQKADLDSAGEEESI